MRFAIVGCGYVVDFYIRTLPNYPKLELAGIFDRNPQRSMRVAKLHGGLRCYFSIEELIADPSVRLVANLTSPHSHYAVSKAALEAGKHVYSEKPLAMRFHEAEELVELAERRGLLLASAPCNILGETAQTLWKALREQRIGTPRLAYAELEDPLHFSDYHSWISESGAPWPFQDELFETGCTLEHAGYYLGWLTAFFGPAKRIVSFAHVLSDRSGQTAGADAPDLAIGCIEFLSGPVARITCGAFATKDHRLRIFGDRGELSVHDCWDYGAPVYLDSRSPGSWRERHRRGARLLGMGKRSLPLVRPSNFASYSDWAHRMDFCRGIAELADAAGENRQPRLSARWSLHVNELALALSGGEGTPHEMRTAFAPIAPMSWADHDVSVPTTLPVESNDSRTKVDSAEEEGV